MKVICIGDTTNSVLSKVIFSIHAWEPGVEIRVARNSREGLGVMQKEFPDLVLICEDFLEYITEVVGSVRRVFSKGLMVVGGEIEDSLKVVASLNAGADDYIKVSYETTEILARIGAVLRRAANPVVAFAKPALQSGDLYFDPATYRVSLGKEYIPLTTTEFRLLQELIEARGSVVDHDTLKSRIWPGSQGPSGDMTKKYAGRVRSKLGKNGKASPWIENAYGVGYRFSGPTPQEVFS